MTRLFALLPLFTLLACDPSTQGPSPQPDDTGLEECIDPATENVLQYLPLDECIAALVGCDTGGIYFEDSCGCGCILEDEDEDCIDPATDNVLQYQPLDECTAALINCDTGSTYFEDSCGCGCLVE